MAKVTKKARDLIRDADHLTPRTKERKKAKTAISSSRSGGKVPKDTKKVKSPLRKITRKKALAKTTIAKKKNKKATGTTLFGHYHRLKN
jgi:hypothetical protein